METARRALRPVLPGAGCTCSARNVRRRQGYGGLAHLARRSFSVGGWSAERRASPIARGRGTPRKRPGLQRRRRPPVPRKHRAPVGAPPTPRGVAIDQSSDVSRRENDRVRLELTRLLLVVLGCLTP